MNILIGNAWPYANGALHLGRIVVLLPGDILARYHRMMGDNVVFLSGTDCHGTPVINKAREEGITPIEIVNKYHKEFQKCFKTLDFSFDIFEKTHTEYHINHVKKFISELVDKGYIYEKEYEGSNHLFFSLSKFEEDVRRILVYQNGWRENAQVILKKYLDEGLRDRAVTREVNWGVDVPIAGFEDKKIFVWIEAVMGYLTASMKCLESRNEDYKEYWQGEDSRVYFVHGKDNIPFHTMIFPAILIGLGIDNPNIRIISSEYMKLEGKPFSSVKNWALWADYVCKNYNVDSFRYYLTLNSPEEKDTDFTWRDYINTNNNDLYSNLANFINKVLTFVNKNYKGRILKETLDNNLKDELLDLYFDVGDNIEEGKFKDGLNRIMNLCKQYNKKFDNDKLWELIEKDSKKCRTLIYNYIQIIANLANLLEPFIPSTCKKVRDALKIESFIWSFVEVSDKTIEDLNLLFMKIDKRKAVEEVIKLKEKKF